MRKKTVLVLVVVFVFLFLLSSQIKPFAILQQFNSDLQSNNAVSDPYDKCTAYVAETIKSYAPYTFPIHECRACPLQKRTIGPTCYLGDGEPCPSGLDCRYPQHDATGGCYGLPCTRDFWQSNRQGCSVPATELPSVYAYMIGQDEIGTPIETRAQAKYMNDCISALPIPPAPDTQVDNHPYSCSIMCEVPTILNQNTCACEDPRVPSSLNFFERIVAFFTSLLRMIGVDW